MGRGAHGPFLTGGKSAAAAAAQVRPRHFLDDPLRIALRQHLGQRLESLVVKVLLDARRIDHAVVPQRNAVLLVEKGHVAVKIEILLADRLLDDAKVRNHLPLDEVRLDDFIEIFLAADAVQHLVRPHQKMGVLAGGLQAARAEAGRRRQPHLVRTETDRLSFSLIRPPIILRPFQPQRALPQ